MRMRSAALRAFERFRASPRRPCGNPLRRAPGAWLEPW